MPWSAEFYEDSHGRMPVKRWMDKLPNVQAAAMGVAVERILQPRGLDLVGTPWLRPLGDGLFEFRVRHSAEEIQAMYSAAGERGRAPHHAVLLRMFVHFHGDKIVLLLNGYDKGRDDSRARQQREIREARKRLGDWRTRQKAGDRSRE